MKKIFITFMAILAVASFTACESKKEEVSEEKTVVSEDISKEEVELTTAATEAETTEADTTEIESETETEAASDEVFRGNGYTLNIDSNVWMNAADYVSYISQMAENLEAVQNYGITAEDIENMNDAMFYHTENMMAGTNFNVIVTEVGNIGEFDKEMLDQLGKAMETQYGAMTGYVYENYEIVNVNGYDSLKINMTTDAEVFGLEFKVSVYLIYNGTKQYTITYTSSDTNYDKCTADFEKVLNSISFE